MITDIAAVTGSSSAAATMKKETGVNKDDFLKLFVTQLQNQDPLNPQDSSQFISQLSQLTQVEQAYNTNTNLSNLLAATQSSTDLSLMSFIGRSVLTTDNHLFLAAGTPQHLNFNLPAEAEALLVQIKNASGQVVRSLSQNGVTAGNGSVLWDGKDNSGVPLRSGLFTYTVAGTKADGTPFSGTSLNTAVIDGVKFNRSGASVLTSGTLEISPQSIVSVNL